MFPLYILIALIALLYAFGSIGCLLKGEGGRFAIYGFIGAVALLWALSIRL